MKIKMIPKISRVAILLGATFAALQLPAQAQSLTLSKNPAAATLCEVIALTPKP